MHITHQQISHFSSHPDATQIQQHHVVVGAVADDIDAAGDQLFSEGCRIGNHLLAIGLKRRLQCFPEGHSLGSDHVLQRAALAAREHGLIELFGELGIAAEDQAAAGAAQGLVGGGGHHIAMGDRAGMHSSGHEAGDVGHIGQQIGTHFISDGAEGGEVDGAWICGVATNNQLRLVLQSQLADRLHIEALGLLVDAVLDDVEPLAADVDRGTMGQVTAMGQIEPHDRVARLQQGQENREVGLGTAVGLHIGPSGTKQLLGPLDGQLFNGINVFTTAVVPLAGQTLGVLVGENGTLGLHHRTGRKVLRCDQLEVGFLTLPFLVDERSDIGIRLSQISVDGASRGLAHGMSVKL